MNYKALNTINYKTKKFCEGGWITRIPGISRPIRNKWKRFKRACNWFWFIYKQPSWQEYESLVAIISKRLRDMSEEFEKTDITMSSQQDAKDMRRTAILLERWCDEYYSSKAWDEAVVKLPLDDWDFSKETRYNPGYDYSHVEKGHEKDQKALRLALKIMERMPGWWQ